MTKNDKRRRKIEKLLQNQSKRLKDKEIKIKNAPIIGRLPYNKVKQTISTSS